jgi:hypothetical protein
MRRSSPVLSLAARVVLSRKASDWASVFDGKPEECVCSLLEDHRGFFTDEEDALFDVSIDCGCRIRAYFEPSEDVLDDVEKFYFSAYGMELADVRERFAEFLDKICWDLEFNIRAVNDVVCSTAASDMPSRRPKILETSAAIFPVHAKFEKTCDPDIVEINCAEYLVARARRPIGKGKRVTKAALEAYADPYCQESCPCHALEDSEEKKLRTQAEEGNVMINCPKCGSCLGPQKKIEVRSALC